MNIKQVIENAKYSNNKEKALLAHCLISSLESVQNEGVDDVWLKLADERLKQLEFGAIKGISWNEIKNEVIRERH